MKTLQMASEDLIRIANSLPLKMFAILAVALVAFLSAHNQ
jgi:hypothetical protein